MNALKKWCEQYRSYSALPIRIAFGIFFMVQGYMKLTDIAGFANKLIAWGFPMADASAWLVALVEFLGGLALLLGLWVELTGLLLGIVMLVAIFKVTWQNGFLAGYAINLLVLGGLLSVMFSGAGKVSLAEKMCSSCKPRSVSVARKASVKARARRRTAKKASRKKKAKPKKKASRAKKPARRKTRRKR